jgi:hypothetical protein
MNKIELSGPFHGKKIIKEYDNPDILYSVVDNKKFLINKLTIIKNKDDTIFVYHSYDKVSTDKKKITYSGRWYNSKLNINDCHLNKKKNMLNVILKNVAWEDFDSNKTIKKDVSIKILFSDKGFEKINKIII